MPVDPSERKEALRDHDDPGTASGDEPVDESRWSSLWQIPAIALSLLLIAAGLWVAMQRAPESDFDGALDQVEQLIANEQFDLAARRLNESIEPNLHLATPEQQARFEAVVADWISLSQRVAGLDLESNNRKIHEHYLRAADLGLPLGAGRLERWAGALISLGDFEGARARLAELDGLAGSGGADLEIRRRRNNVLRRLVGASLRRPELSFESMMEMLENYRADPLLSDADELWAIARQAELRIETGRAREAVSHLLLDMRRFEPKLAENPDLTFAEPYVLLGRGYYELGNFEYGAFHLDRAIQLVETASPVRGDALVLAGRLAVAEGRWHDAFEAFDEAVRDYATTHAAVPARLGRAEVYSVLGDDRRALADFRKVQEQLAESAPRRDVSTEDVTRSLADRHDAALTMGKLDEALEYILLAESLFEPGRVPADVLYRIASTSRQLADDLIAGAGDDPSSPDPESTDPDIRYAANEHYRRAGDAFVAHARTLAGRPGRDQQWADSLWMAADSYDLGGWHADAVTHFTEYVAGRSDADPRRPDAVFRLAQAHHAERDYEKAVRSYEQVINEHPRSHVASRAHVPLARCLLALGRRPEAEQQMMQVVMGERYLEPDAVDFREALIELGSLYYDDEDYGRAIKRLTEAVRRYPEDPRAPELRYRLADSYRHRAATLQEQAASPGVSPAQRDELEARRETYFEAAGELFADVCEGGGGAGELPEQLVRYACLYRADCRFELGRYEEAVGLYDEVAARFPKHHSSMTALIQIVNCYSNLGDEQRARTAHRRALVRLRELPDATFEASDALLDRAAWERWLRNMPVGPERALAESS